MSSQTSYMYTSRGAQKSNSRSRRPLFQRWPEKQIPDRPWTKAPPLTETENGDGTTIQAATVPEAVTTSTPIVRIETAITITTIAAAAVLPKATTRHTENTATTTTAATTTTTAAATRDTTLPPATAHPPTDDPLRLPTTMDPLPPPPPPSPPLLPSPRPQWWSQPNPTATATATASMAALKDANTTTPVSPVPFKTTQSLFHPFHWTPMAKHWPKTFNRGVQ
jgi:hypothetical protein